MKVRNEVAGSFRRILGLLVLSFSLVACGGGGYSGEADPLGGDPVTNPGGNPGTDPGTDPGGAPGAVEDPDLVAGKSEYARHCASCHGSEGQGGLEGPLNNTVDCPTCADSDVLVSYIERKMPTYDVSACGAECARLVGAFIRNGFSTKAEPGTDPGSDPGGDPGSDPGEDPGPGDLSGTPDTVSGGDLYAQQCAKCHGATGNGGVGGRLDSLESCPTCSDQDTLASYIDIRMPSGKQTQCTGSCARDTAAYILEQFFGAGSDPGSDPGTDPGSDPGNGGGTTDPPPEPTCRVDFIVKSQWETGFTGEVQIHNIGDQVVTGGWAVTFRYNEGQKIEGERAWNANLSVVANGYKASAPADYNRTINPDSWVSFGYNASHNGVNNPPTLVGLDAQGCELTPPAPPPPVDSDCTVQPAAPRLLRLLTAAEYENTVRALLQIEPEVSFSDNFPVEARREGFDNNARINLVSSRHVDEYLSAAERAAELALAENPGAVYSCSPSDDNCPAQMVASFGRKAFRRPLSQTEQQAYEGLFDSVLTGGDFNTGAQNVVEAMLISPNFLYRSEVGSQSTQDGVYVLSEYELATALSYLIWGSMPDAELFRAAAAGELSSADNRESQVLRMLDDPRAREQFSRFAAQWLGTDYFFGLFKDPEIYPEFTDSIREAMGEEFKRFVNHVTFDSGEGDLNELLLANYVFVNDELKQFYGLSGPSSGSSFQQLSVTSGIRGGVLGLGAVLGSHAHSTESSPIKRGVFVRERLLCHELPDPDPDIDTTPPGLDPSLTTRERFAQHTDDESCSSCHKFIDGVGFGLERYDGVGGYRASENGRSVDDSGEVYGLEGFDDDSVAAFLGGRQLAQLVAGSGSASHCAVLQHYRFSRGYIDQPEDECALEALTEDFSGDGLRLQDLLINFVRQDGFAVRRGGAS